MIEDGKARSDEKLRFDLLPPDAMVELVRVFHVGAAKHGARNWEEAPFEARRYIAAIQRHVAQWSAGEDVDPEDGCHHLAKVACQALMIVARTKRGAFIDTRRRVRLPSSAFSVAPPPQIAKR